MLMEFLWKLFEKTGDIDSYVFFKQIEHRMNNQENQKAKEEGVAVSS